MRIVRLYLITIYLLVFLAFSPLYVASGEPIVDWIKPFPYGTNIYGNAFDMDASNKYVYFVGYISDKDVSPPKHKLILIATDFLGRVYCLKSPDIISVGHGIDVEVDGNDEYAYVVGYVVSSVGQLDGLLICYKNFDEKWRVSWGSPDDTEIFIDVKVYGDRVYVVGYKYKPKRSIFLACFSKDDGSLLWVKEYTEYYSTDRPRVFIHDDKVYVIARAVKHDSKAIAVLLKYSLDGTLLSEHEYSPETEAYSVYIGDFIIVNDFIYLVGNFMDLDYIYHAYVSKFDLSFNLIWKKEFGEMSEYNIYNYLAGIDIYNGFIYASGGIFYLSNFTVKMILVKLDIDGNVKWYKVYTGSDIWGNGIRIRYYKLYICGGTGESFADENFDIMLMQVSDIVKLKVKTPGDDFWIDNGIEKKYGSEVEFSVPVGAYKIKAASEVSKDSIRYVFVEWEDGSTDNPRAIEILDDIVLEAKYVKQYFIDVQSSYGEVEGGGWYNEGDTATVSVSETIVDHGNDTRRVFTEWMDTEGNVLSSEQTYSFTVTQPITLIAKWDTQYYIRIYSEYSNCSGEGWYRKGSTATISIESEKIEGIPFNKVFKGWRDETGSIVSTQQIYYFTVDGPKTFTAVWEEELNIVFIAVLGALILAIVAVTLILRRRRGPPPPPPPPPP